MALTLEFLWHLAGLLRYVLPLFAGLGGIIAGLSVLVGRRESWSVTDSLYFGFITALTVGYGDFRPTTGFGKFIAIVIAMIGLILSGILVAVAIEAVSITFEKRR